MPRVSARPTAALFLLLGTACGGNPGPVPEAAPYTDPGYAEAGAYRMHYALTPTRDLPSGIAGSYGIVARRNLALLAITLAPSERRWPAPAGEAEVEAIRIELTGARQALPLTRHDEPGGPTWLAAIEVRHRVPITIEIRARATPAGPDLHARLTREFRLD